MPSLSTPPLAAHPRLLVSAAQLERLQRPPALPLLKKMSRLVATLAEKYQADARIAYDENLHNSLLLRARSVQGRIITLLVRWKQTGRESFRKAALRDLQAMAQWEYWAWDGELDKNRDPKAYFDLSYGENSATVALAYDWLHDTLSREEKQLFHRMAREKIFAPFLALTPKRKPAWWFRNHQSNWNTVCAGGAGMAALAFLDEIPAAAEVLQRADFSIAPYMESLETTEGGWQEGIGYWNYGHRYAFWYLLSHERTTGRLHPLMKLKGTRQTLQFPFDFCPHGQPCSFGDVNTWSPLPFHYAAATRLGCPELVPQLDRLVSGEDPKEIGCWPNAAELLLFHPGTTGLAPAPQKKSADSPALKLYRGIDWGILADRLPDPAFYFSIRGGKSGWEVPHSHQDLGTFQCVVGTERLIDNPGANGGREYLDTTFSNRRFELFETTPRLQERGSSQWRRNQQSGHFHHHAPVRPRLESIPGRYHRIDLVDRSLQRRFLCPALSFLGPGPRGPDH